MLFGKGLKQEITRIRQRDLSKIGKGLEFR